MRIAIFENLPLGGARRASYELGRQLAERNEIDLFRLDLFNEHGLDLADCAQRVFDYPFSPLFGMLGARVRERVAERVGRAGQPHRGGRLLGDADAQSLCPARP